MALQRAVTVIEAISRTDAGQDGPILTEVLKMAGWKYTPHEIRAGTVASEKRQFLDALLKSEDRFIHISAHGHPKGLLALRERKTAITIQDIAEYAKGAGLTDRSLDRRLVTMSACGEISGRLATEFHEATGASAVISPLAEVDFAHSATFMVMFYFVLRNYPTRFRSLRKTPGRIAQYIDSFQRTKQAYLAVGGAGAFHLDYWWQDEHVRLH